MKQPKQLLAIVVMMTASSFAAKSQTSYTSAIKPGIVISANTPAKAPVTTYFQSETPVAGDGSIILTTEKGETKVIEYVMAYGSNVKALNIQVNDGFSYKLAPAGNAANLNYVGSSLGIVVKDGDKVKIEFVTAGKSDPAERHIYVSGYSTK